jgi:drug/metabolite transporter (DMT)-like permease
VVLALVAAAFWALGTQTLRRTRLDVPALTISFWMTVLTAVLVAACVWALGTHLLRRSSWPLPLLTLVFWMTAVTAVVVSLMALVFEHDAARWPPPHTAWAIAYNAVGVFGFAHAAWFHLARVLPPVASTLSVMMIPVLGCFSGAWALGEALHWQDFAAMALMVAAIAAVLWRR